MNLSVIGAGAWGTAFSMHLARKGHDVLLWIYEDDLYDTMRETRENGYYLSGFSLPERIRFTKDLELVAAATNTLVVATPSFALCSTMKAVSTHLSDKKILVLTKGLETESLLRMSQIVAELQGTDQNVAVLSGPSFAREVAQSAFTSVVVASKEKTLARYFQGITHDERLRVYTSEDVVGVELGGALKNVMAIGAGVIEGLRLGSNTVAAYITRALAEIKRLGRRLGARETTFMGLSGMGDLILTCTGPLSRNRLFGVELAKGRKPEEILHSQKSVVEGYYTIKAGYRLSRSLQVEMPITEELYRIIYEDKNILSSIEDIQKREIKEEDA